VLSGTPDGVNAMGSMGGRVFIGWDEDVISSHNSGNGELIER